MDRSILTYIVFLPLVGALLIWILPRAQKTAIRFLSLAVMGFGLVLGFVLWAMFDPALGEMQLATKPLTWFTIAGVDIHYQLGIDGISLLLVELTLLLGPLVILSSWSAVNDKVKEYHIFGVWGGERKIYAAIKFFLFTLAGSVLMLLGIIYVAFLPGVETFDVVSLTQAFIATPLKANVQYILFGAFALSFAIKVPMFPFHTWLPDAHVEAPTAGSVILAGVLLKMGTYGFIRFAMPMFPYAAYQAIPIIWTLALIGIIYGALVAMVQADVKKLVAYSSVSHLGFVMLGLFALTEEAIQGSILQMVNHGLSTGALFLLVGVIYERRHTRLISEFGGLAKVMPVFAIFFMIVTLSSIGLPGLNGFVGEFLILAGTYTSNVPHAKIATVLAASGVILAACYMLWMFQRVMFGPLTKDENKKLKDLNAREIVYLSALLIFIVWIGVYHKTFTSRSEQSVRQFIVNFEEGKRRTEGYLINDTLADGRVITDDGNQ